MWCITVRGFVVRTLHRHDRCVYIRTDVPEGFVIHIYDKSCVGRQVSDTAHKNMINKGFFGIMNVSRTSVRSFFPQITETAFIHKKHKHR